MIEQRCPHAFLRSCVRCPVCDRTAQVGDSEADTIRGFRRPPAIRLPVGSILGGATVVRRDEDVVTMRCGCGDEFEIHRKTVARRVVSDPEASFRCRACRLVDEREHMQRIGRGAA